MSARAAWKAARLVAVERQGGVCALCHRPLRRVFDCVRLGSVQAFHRACRCKVQREQIATRTRATRLRRRAQLRLPLTRKNAA